MFRTFFPDEYLDSTYVIDFEKLYAQGYRGLIFDIDNTLVPHGAPACLITSMKGSLPLIRMFRCIL